MLSSSITFSNSNLSSTAASADWEIVRTDRCKVPCIQNANTTKQAEKVERTPILAPPPPPPH